MEKKTIGSFITALRKANGSTFKKAGRFYLNINENSSEHNV